MSIYSFTGGWPFWEAATRETWVEGNTEIGLKESGRDFPNTCGTIERWL
jgi:hypothetical protein